MSFEIVGCDPETNEFGHPYRVSTRSFHYKLKGLDGEDRWRMHWEHRGDPAR